MKLYIKSLMLSGLLAASACTDLDTDINTRYTELPDNPIVVEGEFNGCYKFLHGWFGRDFLEGVMLQGDEIMGCNYGLGNYWDDGRIFDGSVHSLHLDNWRTKIIDGCMSGCTYTNEKIAAYGGPQFNDPGVAPLRAIRAFYIYWMMELYGDCPLMNHVVEPGEILNRTPRAEVCRWLEQELLEILNQEGALSKANDVSTYGKPNYWMAAALLAKIYLNWGVYTNDITTVDFNTPNPKLAECLKWCNEIIYNGPFALESGYRKKFFPDNGVHIKDFIYALDVDPDGKMDGSATWYRWCAFKKYGLVQPAILGFDLPASTAGVWIMTKEAVNRFNLPNDERNLMVQKGLQYQYDNNYNQTDVRVYLYANIAVASSKLFQLNFIEDFMFDDASILNLGDESSPKAGPATRDDGTALMNIRKGARLFKFPPREQDYTLWERQQANNYPIFRLADIILMKAECIMRGVSDPHGDTFEGLINQVRAVSGAPSVNVAQEGANPASGLTPQAQVLLDERSRELIEEPWRRNDLIRFGQFEADWGMKNKYTVWDIDDHYKADPVEGVDYHWVERPGAKDHNRRLMPIHREVLQANTNWSQNPGYQGI